MTLFVRLANGAEDQFQTFVGCVNCGWPRTDKVYQGDADVGDVVLLREIPDPSGLPNHWIQPEYGCASCDASETSNVYETTVIKVGQVNPAASNHVDGTLTVEKGKTRLAFYPAGVWVSWIAT